MFKVFVAFAPAWIKNIPAFNVFVKSPKAILFEHFSVPKKFFAVFTFVTVEAAHFNFLFDFSEN